MTDDAASKTITLNGEPRQTAAATIAELLAEVGLSEARRVAALLNGEIVPRDERDRAPVADGDAVDIVSLVGGG